MTKRIAFFYYYRMVTEVCAIAFAWWAYEWKAAMLTFLVLWAFNVSQTWHKLDREPA